MVLDQTFVDLLKSTYINFDLMVKDGQIGSKKSKSKGSSVEFSDYRQYTHGDDFRRIDWNAYARFEKLFIKLFLEEREASIHLFMDVSQSMAFYQKDMAAMKVAAAYIYFALAGYDKVSIYPVGGHENMSLRNIKGSSAFHRAVSLMEGFSYGGQARLYDRVRYSTISKGMTVIISDFLNDEDLDQILKYLHFKKQKVVLAHVLSKEELEPEFEEHVRLIDSENNQHMELMMESDMIRIYKKALSDHMDKIQKAAQKYQCDYIMYHSNIRFEKFLKEMAVKG